MKTSTDQAPPVEIPLDLLSSEILKGVIDSFVEREGTDYGAVEASYEIKFQQLLKQLKNGYLKIIFDPNTETVTLVTKEFWEKNQELFPRTN